MTEIQLVYTDIQTGRVGRIADYGPMITPAELEEFTWQTARSTFIPKEVYINPMAWEVSITGTYKQGINELSIEEQDRIALTSIRAECLEQVSRLINIMRFRRAKHVFGYHQISPMYDKEILEYRETQVPGPLLLSLVDDIEDLPVAIAEIELAHAEYDNFLRSTEELRNKWMRQVKNADNPVQAAENIKRVAGI